MRTFWIRKKPSLWIAVATICLFVSMGMLLSLRSSSSVGIQSDYDLHYDIYDDAGEMADELSRERRAPLDMNILSNVKHMERRVQAHVETPGESHYDTGDNEDYTNPDYNTNVKLKTLTNGKQDNIVDVDDEDDEEDDDEIIEDKDDSDGYYDDENDEFKTGDFDMQNYKKFSVSQTTKVQVQQNDNDAIHETDDKSIDKHRQLSNSLDIQENNVQYSRSVSQGLHHNNVKMDSKSRTLCKPGQNCAANRSRSPEKTQLLKKLVTINPTENKQKIDKNVSQIKKVTVKPQTQIPRQDVDSEHPLEVPTMEEGVQNTLMSPIPEHMAPSANGNVTVRSNMGIPIIVDNVFWSDDLLQYVPKGPSPRASGEFVNRVKHLRVKQIEEARWDRCGRDKNKFVRLEDGTELCARYRSPHTHLVKGEVLSFYLARWLGLDNIPITLLSEVNESHLHWRGHNLTAHGWNQGQIVALIQYIDNINILQRSRVPMPDQLLKAYETQHPLGRDSPFMASLTVPQLTQLSQWTQMIVFDYLTGNYDRIASMQDGADKENKPKIMHEIMRNLRQNYKSGKLWLIDNESGMFDGYELLYHSKDAPRFIKFHQQMLQSICIFDKQMVTSIESLLKHKQPHKVLEDYAQKHDPLYNKVPSKLHKYEIHFKNRLKEIINWVDRCKR